MNQKELNELRRRWKPDKNTISRIYGCFVNGNKEIITDLDESLGMMTQEEAEKYLSLLKKALSGALGKNNYWGKYKRLAPIGFGLMFMLSVYASYGMRESWVFNRVDLQTLSFFFIGTIASMIGMVLGHALFADQKSKEKSK